MSDPLSLLSESKYIDIAINLIDPMYRGLYHGKQKHEDDMEDVLQRAKFAHVRSMIITGGSLEESKEALQLARETGLYATIGCHPTRSGQFESHSDGPDEYLRELDSLISVNLEGRGRAVAVGECGLDYDRTHFATPDIQKKYFRVQLGLAKKYHLPLFLHSRAAHKDFVRILRDEGFGVDGGTGVGGNGGVVHSFTGSSEEAAELVSMGFYIGVNGCSLKTQDNLDTAKSIPIDKLMLETDGPWCSMNATHASKQHLDSMPLVLREVFLPPAVKAERFARGKVVKGRNEPMAIGAVAWVMHCLLEIPYQTLVNATWDNTVKLFGLSDLAKEEKPLLNSDSLPRVS